MIHRKKPSFLGVVLFMEYLCAVVWRDEVKYLAVCCFCQGRSSVKGEGG